MPEVISDTSPIQYLFQSDHLDLLPALYGKVLVPEGVAEEISDGRTLGHALPNNPQAVEKIRCATDLEPMIDSTRGGDL